jgi:hypothetical protein
MMELDEGTLNAGAPPESASPAGGGGETPLAEDRFTVVFPGISTLHDTQNRSDVHTAADCAWCATEGRAVCDLVVRPMLSWW